MTWPLLSRELFGIGCSIGAILLVFAFSDLLRRRGTEPESTRKAAHLLTACALLPLPTWIHHAWSLAALAGIIGLLIAFLRSKRKLRFLDDVSRSRKTEYAFIGGVAVTYLLVGDRPFAYRAALLVLGTGDAAAAIVGKRWGRHRFGSATLPYLRSKSWEGSLAFVGVAWISIQIARITVGGALGDSIVLDLAVATLAAAVEATCPPGYDNFAIPVSIALSMMLADLPPGSISTDGACLRSPIWLLLLLPNMIAGLAHQLARKHGFLAVSAIPLDRLLFARRVVFGDNKTLRGFIVVPTVSALSAVALELSLRSIEHGRSLTGIVFPYAHASSWRVAGAGAFVGLASMLGELPNSYLKRRLGIQPGEASTNIGLRILDRVDGAIASSVALLFLGISPLYIVPAFLVAPVVHTFVNMASARMRLRSTAWSLPLFLSIAVTSNARASELVFRNQTSLRFHPIGAMNESKLGIFFGPARTQEAGQVSTGRDLYVGANLTVTPAFMRAGIAIEATPFRWATLYVTSEAGGFFGTLGSLRTYASADVASLADADVGQTPALGQSRPVIQTIAGTYLNAGSSMFQARGNVRIVAEWVNLGRSERTFYDPNWDILVATYLIAADVDLLSRPSKGVKLGLRYSLLHSLLPDDIGSAATVRRNATTQKMGPIASVTLPDFSPAFRSPTFSLLTQWWLSHPFRTGTTPYVGISFGFRAVAE